MVGLLTSTKGRMLLLNDTQESLCGEISSYDCNLSMSDLILDLTLTYLRCTDD